jgi:hypothetical protein
MALPKSQAWDVLPENPKANERNTAEVQLLWELRQALRRRTVHIPSSLSFQSRAKMLDPRGSTIRAPRSDYPFKTMITELIEEIEHGLERVSEAVERGDLKIDGTKIKVRRLTAQRTPSELKGVRRELYGAYTRVQFPHIIMAVDAETHFSAEILGRPADNETELLHLYAGILGQSMDLSANRLSLMVGLTPEGLAHAMHVLEDPARLVRANEAVLTYMHSHAIARTWGSPFDCAADAMSLDMPITSGSRVLTRSAGYRAPPLNLRPYARLAGYLQRSLDHDHAAAGGPRDRRDPWPGTLEDCSSLHRHARLLRLRRESRLERGNSPLPKAQEPQRSAPRLGPPKKYLEDLVRTA